jgi:hypothetical protein
MSRIDVTLISPHKHKLAQRPPTEIVKGRICRTIESVFSNLWGQMRLDQHLASTPNGPEQRIARRLLVPTLAMLINILTGRPPRGRAYDGRRTHINL